MNKFTLFLALFSTSILCGLSCQNQKSVNTKTVYESKAQSMLLPALEFKKQWENSKNIAHLVDVRTADEFKSGTLLGALNIDFQKNDFETNLQKLDKTKTLFIFCQKGGRSAKAHNIAQKIGFQQIIEMDGGYEAWLANTL
jgi:rhodanese-related sulfurtransferase